MARCPFATWRPLPENATQPALDASQAILHSGVDSPGRTTLYGYFAQEVITLESHFWVYLDGEIEQYIDTSRTADANYHANVRAISIETEDDGDPDRIPWTPAQIASIIRLLDWICDEHPKVARTQCPAWDQPGLGWHTMWGAPSHWTPVRGKTCPGRIRITQIPDIFKAVQEGGYVPTEDFLSALTPEQQKEAFVRIVDTHDRLTRLTPFAAERINRKGEQVDDGVVADPSVRWAIEDVVRGRATEQVVREAVQAALVGVEGHTIDPVAIADAVVNTIKDRL